MTSQNNGTTAQNHSTRLLHTWAESQLFAEHFLPDSPQQWRAAHRSSPGRGCCGEDSTGYRPQEVIVKKLISGERCLGLCLRLHIVKHMEEPALCMQQVTAQTVPGRGRDIAVIGPSAAQQVGLG